MATYNRYLLEGATGGYILLEDGTDYLLLQDSASGPPGMVLWPASTGIPFEHEVIRQPNNQGLFQFIPHAVVPAVPGQPWYLWRNPVLPPEPDPVQPVIDLQALNRFRKAGQVSPGQPWYLWPKSQPQFDVEVIGPVDSQGLFKLPRKVAQSAYQPLLRLEPVLYIPSEGLDLQLPDHSLFFNYVTGATSTPWWIWPAAKRPDDVEPIQPIDNSQALFRFIRLPPAPPPTPGITPIWPTSQWIPFLLEPDPRPPDYSQLLFFGRKPASGPTAGQPWYLWPRGFTALEPDPQPASVDAQALFRFRVPGTAAPSQPFWIWPGQRGYSEPDQPIGQPDHSHLFLYRTGYQTVGQPFWMFQARPGALVEEPVPVSIDSQALFRFRGQIPFSGPYQPFWVWPRVIGSPDPEIPFRDPNSYALFAFRQIYPTPPPVTHGAPKLVLGMSMMILGGRAF